MNLSVKVDLLLISLLSALLALSSQSSFIRKLPIIQTKLALRKKGKDLLTKSHLSNDMITLNT